MTTTRHGARMTLAEYLATDMEGVWELADGELYEMPPPNVDHQQLLGVIYATMWAHVVATAPRLGRVLWGVGVVLSESTLLIPDLVFLSAGRESLLRRNYIYGGPDLVVEALSSDRLRDLTFKREWYAVADVPEYWILDPVHDTLTILELSNGEYIERAVLSRDDILSTPIIPGYELALARVFDDPDREPVRADR